MPFSQKPPGHVAPAAALDITRRFSNGESGPSSVAEIDCRMSPTPLLGSPSQTATAPRDGRVARTPTGGTGGDVKT
ncbi:unnamed protein product [Lampetra fluviatilis]